MVVAPHVVEDLATKPDGQLFGDGAASRLLERSIPILKRNVSDLDAYDYVQLRYPLYSGPVLLAAVPLR